MEFSVFLSRSFIVVLPTLRSLIHFELIFICSVRWGPDLLLLCADIRSSQLDMLKRLCFSLSVVLLSLSKTSWPYSWWFISGLSSVHWSICLSLWYQGFPHSWVGKESTCSAGDPGSIPGSGRSSGEGNGYYSLRYSCLENPVDRGAWQTTIHEIARVGYDLVTKPPCQYHF